MAQSIDNTNKTAVGQKLVIEGGKKLSMNGVESVDGFADEYIRLTSGGKAVNITGGGIKITSFNKASGVLTADGNFYGVKYGGEKISFFKKIFK